MINSNRQIGGSFRTVNAHHPKVLEIDEWTQIIVTFGSYHANPTGNFGVLISIVINGEEKSTVTPDFPTSLPIPSSNNAKMTIGEGGDFFESFKGSVGLVEIFSPGAVIQTSKYIL